jgi:hypothetical protein
VHVVEAGRVLEQVNHANGEFRLPGVVDADLRRDLRHRRIEVDLVVEI